MLTQGHAAEIIKLAQSRPDIIIRGGNSSVSKVRFENQTFAVKNYSSRSNWRVRRDQEWWALKLLLEESRGLAPEPLWHASENPLAIHSWIEGNKPDLTEVTTISMTELLRSLQRVYRSSVGFKNLRPAVDSISDGSDLHSQILNRLSGATASSHPESGNLSQEIGLALNRLVSQPAKTREPYYPELTLSPSDFGPHNLLVSPEKQTIAIIDLEFFGVDDLWKLIGDTVLHPQNRWTEVTLELFLSETISLTEFASKQRERLWEVLPFLSLKWSTIVLGRMSLLGTGGFQTKNDTNLSELVRWFVNISRVKSLDSLLSAVVARHEQLTTEII